MKPVLALVAAVLVALLAAAPALAAIPPNDDFAAATPLTAGTVLLTDNLGATSQPGEPDEEAAERGPGCASLTARPQCGSSVWFTFTAPASQTYVVDNCDSPASFDSAITVFTGATPATLTTVGYDDDGPSGAPRPCGLSSSVAFGAAAGTTYRIRLSGLEAIEDTTYLGVFAGAAPPASAAGTALRPSDNATDPMHFSSTASGGRRTASFVFTTTPESTQAECSLDGAAFAACTSPVSYPVPADPAVAHQFRVRAAGDPTPATARFTIDRTPPDTGFREAPAEGASTPLPVGFQSEAADPFEARAATVTCAIDEVSLFPCASSGLAGPFSIDAALCNGVHTASAAVFDHAGNLDPTPASRSFSTTANAPCTSGLPQLTTPTFVFNNANTSVTVTSMVTTNGRYAAYTFEYGAAAGAYTDGALFVLPPFTGSASKVIGGRVTPGATYHYRLTVRTASGSRSTADGTFTVPPVTAGTAAQAVSVGTPVMAGPTALTVPVTVTNGTPARAVYASALVDDEPIVLQSRSYPRPAVSPASAAATGPSLLQIPLTDVEPGSTLHVRVITQDTMSQSAATKFTLSPDVAFTVPPADPGAGGSGTGGGTMPGGGTTPGGGGATTTPPTPPTPPSTPPKAFKLTTSLVSVARFSRRSKSLRVTVKGLPAKAKLSVAVKGKKTLATLSPKAASKAGSRTLVLKLGKGARAALKVKSLKRLSFVVSVTPVGAKKQSVTKRVTLK